MRIGELSRRTGASPRAIRYYEQSGLLQPERQPNGYREFDDTAVQTVTTIRTLFDLGFPSELVSRVLPCTGEAGPVAGDCSALMQRVSEIRDEMDVKARRLDATRDQLNQFLATANQQ